MVSNILIVALGSAIGGVLRYLAAYAARSLPAPVPWWTLGVNVVGAFIIGIAAATLVGSERSRLLIMTGFCGGLTTFSAFSLETLELLQEHAYAWAFANVALNVILSIAACWAGYSILAKQG